MKLRGASVTYLPKQYDRVRNPPSSYSLSCVRVRTYHEGIRPLHNITVMQATTTA